MKYSLNIPTQSKDLSICPKDKGMKWLPQFPALTFKPDIKTNVKPEFSDYANSVITGNGELVMKTPFRYKYLGKKYLIK